MYNLVYFVQSWTTALCNADSDGDGVSNGAELGDPNCIWTAGGERLIQHIAKSLTLRLLASAHFVVFVAF